MVKRYSRYQKQLIAKPPWWWEGELVKQFKPILRRKAKSRIEWKHIVVCNVENIWSLANKSYTLQRMQIYFFIYSFVRFLSGLQSFFYLLIKETSSLYNKSYSAVYVFKSKASVFMLSITPHILLKTCFYNLYEIRTHNFPLYRLFVWYNKWYGEQFSPSMYNPTDLTLESWIKVVLETSVIFGYQYFADANTNVWVDI